MRLRYFPYRLRAAISVLATLVCSTAPVATAGAGEASTPSTLSRTLLITQQPTSQTVTIGQKATFSVEATGAGPLTYQWFKNGSALDDATNTSYTTPATSDHDNASLYYVVVGNSTEAPIASNIISLHVNALETVAVPTILPNGGTFTGLVQVSLRDATAGAQLFYTTDGSAPSMASMRYATPITLITNTTLRVIALKSNMNPSSEPAPAVYVINRQPTSPIPIPDVGALNGKAFTPLDTLSVAYSGSCTGFNWQFEPLSGTVVVPSVSAHSPGHSATTIATASPQLKLSTFGLATGAYNVSVQAINGGQTSEWSYPATFNFVETDFSSVRVFPNPWRAARNDGDMTFDQLPANSTVKIYTLSGKWVKSLDASSGRAVWPLTNDSGDKVASGIYFYLISDTSGHKSKGKFTIIR